MKIAVALYAVKRFHELQIEHAEVINAIGLSALVCVVRQKGADLDGGWVCHEVGIAAPAAAFWGKFSEVRGGKAKEVLIVIDLESVDSIEFEIYEQQPVES